MEINYDELFGLESENTEEVADSPVDEAEEPAEVEAAEEDAGEKESEPAEQTGQSREERAKFAAARRKAEEDDRVRKGIDEAISSIGLTNPFTGKAVTSRAELDEYSAAVSKEKKEAILDKSGMSEAELNEYVGNLPEVRALRQKAETLEAQQRQNALNEAIREITEIDPSITSVEDLRKMDNYSEFFDKVQRGYRFKDAYIITNYDRMNARKAASAAKQTALNVAGKNHLKSTKERGEGSVTVPRETMEQYRALLPNATEAEITAHYNRYHKKG